MKYWRSVSILTTTCLFTFSSLNQPGFKVNIYIYIYIYLIGPYYAGPNLTPAPLTPALITPVPKSYKTKKGYFSTFKREILSANDPNKKHSSLANDVTGFEDRRFFQNVLFPFENGPFNASPINAGPY